MSIIELHFEDLNVSKVFFIIDLSLPKGTDMPPPPHMPGFTLPNQIYSYTIEWNLHGLIKSCPNPTSRPATLINVLQKSFRRGKTKQNKTKNKKQKQKKKNNNNNNNNEETGKANHKMRVMVGKDILKFSKFPNFINVL